MTAIPPITWTPEGVILPTDAAILNGAQSDIDTAFGGGVNPSLSTPQGQIATSEAALVAQKNSEIAYIANQVDPQYAQGRFQDAIGRLYFLKRKPAVSTVVICTLGGVAGTVIPAGALALDTAQNTYQLLGAVTIGSGGTITGEFANLVTGPIPCPAGSLTQIYQAVSGWDTITNANAGTPGSVVESSQEFELRRQNSVAANSHGTVDAIFAAVAAVSGVLSVYVIDNPSGSVVNYGSTNYPLAAHSIYVAVVGGEAAAIAQAIWQFKDSGCSYQTAAGEGTLETVVVTDTNGYSDPPPSYSVSFIVPGTTSVYFAVKLTSVPSGLAALVQTAIVAQFNGQNGNTPAGIASLITASSYYAAVLNAIADTGVTLVSILVGLSPSPSGFDSQVGIDQEPTLDASNITVTT
jgi:Baseplate J-like protein